MTWSSDAPEFGSLLFISSYSIINRANLIIYLFPSFSSHPKSRKRHESKSSIATHDGLKTSHPFSSASSSPPSPNRSTGLGGSLGPPSSAPFVVTLVALLGCGGGGGCCCCCCACVPSNPTATPVALLGGGGKDVCTPSMERIGSVAEFCCCFLVRVVGLEKPF